MCPPSEPGKLSRREMLARLFNPLRRATAEEKISSNATSQPSDYSHIAVIAGRDCVAYQGIHCTDCLDHCPVPGAIVIEQGLPRVVPTLCTGCRACHEVCPAPENAIRIVLRPPGLPAPKVGG